MPGPDHILRLVPPPPLEVDLCIDVLGRTARAREPQRPPFAVHFQGWCFHAVTSGAGVVEVDGRPIRLLPGDVLLFCPGQFLRYGPVPGEPWAYTFVSMRGRGVADILGGLGLARTAQAVRVPPSAPFWRWLEAYGAEVLAGGGGGLAAVVAAWRFLELLLAGRGVAGDPAAGDLANACAQLLHHRLGEPLAVAGLARHFGVNRSTLFRAFRVAFGMSLATYQQRLRLDHACALLRRTDQSVLAVSRQCGFSDPSYFARAFRKHTGETPQAWRRGGQAD